MYYAILMADVKDSGKKDPKILMANFKKLIAEINTKQKTYIISPLTITLGDEFQCVAKNVVEATNLIYSMEELIVKKQFDFKLKYVVNYGQIDTKINKKIAYEMLGQGLTDARRYLNEIKKEDTRFLIQGNKNEELTHLANNAFLIYQSIVDSWKSKDLKTVSAFLLYGDYKKVAAHIKTDTSSAWRRKKSLKINEYLAIKEIITFLIK